MRGQLQQKSEVNLFDFIRRIAITRQEVYRGAARRCGVSRLRDRILDEGDWLCFWSKLIAHEKSCTMSTPRLLSLFGDRAAEVLNALESELQTLPCEDDRAMAMIDDYLLRTIWKIDQEAIHWILRIYDVPESLPLVDELVEFLRVQGHIFENTVIIGSQHVLGSNFALLASLNKLGVDFENIYILGKPYSTSRPVAWIMRDRGINVDDDSFNFPTSAVALPATYENTRTAVAAKIFSEASNAMTRLLHAGKILILEDGGTVINMLQNLENGDLTRNVVAVEQTTSGIHRIRNDTKELTFPVVNVAESRVKQDRESPWIAKSIIRELLVRLESIRGIDSLANLKVLVLGYGPVGVSVAHEIARRTKNRANITVGEPDTAKIRYIRTANLNLAPHNMKGVLPQFDVIIGCTGVQSLKAAALKYIKADTLIASASSSNKEFNGFIGGQVGFFKWHWIENFEQDSDFQRCHNDYIIEGAAGKVWLLNGGFPINFSGAIDPIPPQIIQLTRSLMLGGAIEAMELSGKSRIFGLRKEIQDFIQDRFNEYEKDYCEW